MHRHPTLVYLVIVAVLALAAGAWAATRDQPGLTTDVSALSGDSSPQQVVRTFFGVVNSDDPAKARTLVWRPFRGGAAPDPYGFEGIAIHSVDAGHGVAADTQPRAYRRFPQLWIVDVSHGRDEMGDGGSWQVLLGRRTSTEPWLVLEILGSGP